MLGSQGTPRVNAREYDRFIGLDVDKTSMAVMVIDHADTAHHVSMPAQAEPVVAYVRRHFPQQRVAFAYEAGPTGYRLYDALTAAGYPCLVVAPSMVPRAPGQRVKTNRLDAQQLAFGLRGGQLRSIVIPTMPYRHLRHLTQLRDTAVQQARAAKCRLKALLLYEGLAFPSAPASSQWSQRVLAALQQLPCAAPVRFKLDRLLEQLAFGTAQAVQISREIRRFCQAEPELAQQMHYLLTVPGLGWSTASQLLARIGDWRQLRSGRQLAAFLGVVASEHSTGASVRRGAITRVGDARLRNKLLQCAWVAIRTDPELRAFYQRIAARHPQEQGARKAIVAVTRKLTTRIAAVLIEQRPYVLRQPPAAERTPLGETRVAAEPGS